MQSFIARTLLARSGACKLAVLALVVGFSAGCDVRDQPDQARTPPEVDVAPVLVEAVTITETFTGHLQAPQTVQLRPRVSGYIQEVTFKEGELVEAGDLLFRIDPRPYQAQLKAAKAELEHARTRAELARREARRARRLMEQSAISREEHDQRQSALARARARVSMAEAAVETAELDLEYTRVTAPVSGRAGRAMITKGNLARADRSLLTTIVSVDPLHVYFDSNESAGMGSLPLVSPGSNTAVSVTVNGNERTPRTGRLDYIGNRLDAGTGTLTFRAVLPNPGGKLRPGQFARVEMPVTRLQNAVLVDRKAVLTDQDRRYVYVVGEDNKVERRSVRPSRKVGGLLVIDEGLKSGDRVVVDGTQRIFGAGMSVVPNVVAMRSDSPGSDVPVAMSQP